MRGEIHRLRTSLIHWQQKPAWAYMLVILATLFWAGNVTLGRALRYEAGFRLLLRSELGLAGN